MASSDMSQLGYASVVVPDTFGTFPRTISGPNILIQTGDASGLQFLVEEFIALGATDVVVAARALLAKAVPRLPEELKRRIRVVNVGPTLLQTLNAFTEPLTEEYGAEFQWPHGLTVTKSASKPDVDRDLVNALYVFEQSFYQFMLAARAGAEVDVDLATFSAVTRQIRASSRNPEARARLAVIEGLLSTYEPITFDAVRTTSVASGQIVDLFNDLVGDATYQALSRNAKFFGVPVRCRHAATKIGRAATRLVEKRAFRGLLSLGGSVVNAATGATLPDASVIESVVGARYIPPFVSLSEVIVRAREMWRRANPECIPLGGEIPPGAKVHDAA